MPEGFSNKLVTKPATQSMVNGSMVRSDGIILVPGNREDLITWALDPKMSGDTLGLLLPTLFVIIGAQLKQVAGGFPSTSRAPWGSPPSSLPPASSRCTGSRTSPRGSRSDVVIFISGFQLLQL